MDSKKAAQDWAAFLLTKTESIFAQCDFLLAIDREKALNALTSKQGDFYERKQSTKPWWKSQGRPPVP
jgi:hypothetical protein